MNHRMVWVLVSLSCAATNSVGAPVPIQPRDPQPVNNGSLALSIDPMKKDWETNKLPAMCGAIRNVSNQPQIIHFTDSRMPYRKSSAVVTFILAFPDGEVVEAVPLLEKMFEPRVTLQPGKEARFRVSAWELSEAVGKKVSKSNSKVAITALVAGMGLQSNTLALRDAPIPKGYKPLSHTQFTPALHKKRDDMLRTKCKELGIKYPFDDE